MTETTKNTNPNIPTARASEHAIDQFITRSRCQRKREAIGPKLERMLSKSKEVIKKNATRSLLNNGCVEARYFLRSGWVLVVVNGVITTCYQPKLKEFDLI